MVQISDCYWEIANIGKKTCEVSLGANDCIDKSLLDELDSKYEYQVIKVAPGNIEVNVFLMENGYFLIENQIEVEKKYKDFDYDAPLIKYLMPKVSFQELKTQDEFESIFEQMTPNMFISDRIALDPNFGLDYSYNRYRNWMQTAFKNNSASFIQFICDGKPVGFSMYRIKDNAWQGDLGGVYPGCGDGLGLLTPSAPFLYMKQREIKLSKMVSHISSNNVPVFPPYNYCHFNFKSFTYVFVKHNQI